MKLKEKVDFLITELESLYTKLEIPLNHKDSYTLLIAVLLSAQSTDKKVNEITPILFKKANNPYDMIKLSIVPPKQPAKAPNRVPIINEINTDINPIDIDILVA